MAEEKRDRWYSFLTQVIANYLPDHSKIRRLKSSNGQELINSMAMHLEELTEAMDFNLRNMFFPTASLDNPDIYWFAQLDPALDIKVPEHNRNLLKNSSFGILTNARALPDYWQCSPTDSDITAIAGMIGDKAMRMTVTEDETVMLYQDIDEYISSGTSITVSCWYRITKNLTGTVTIPDDTFGLHLVLTLRDGTQESYLSNFADGTGGNWRRLSFTYRPTKDVAKMRVLISLPNSGTFNWLDPVDVDCLQVERSSSATRWIPHIHDKPFYLDLDPSVPASVVFESGTRAQYVESINDFWIKAIPTRATVESATYDSYGSASARVFGGLEVDFWKNRIPYFYHAYNNKIRKKGVEEYGGDIFADYSLAFTNFEGEYTADTAITVLAVNFFHGKLWAVITGADRMESTKTYLVVIEHRVPHPEPTYLEVIACIELPDAPALSDRLFIRYEDQQHLLVGTSSNLVLYRLYYDYFMVDRTRKLALFRENYEDVVPMVVESVKRDIKYELRR